VPHGKYRHVFKIIIKKVKKKYPEITVHNTGRHQVVFRSSSRRGRREKKKRVNISLNKHVALFDPDKIDNTKVNIISKITDIITKSLTEKQLS
jgi:hypothetical protein